MLKSGKTMGVTSFTRLTRLFFERGVSVSVTVTIEEMKRVLYPLKRHVGTYSKALFFVSGILGRVAENHHFLVEVDSKNTEETYDHIFEWLILIDPETKTFQSEEYVIERVMPCMHQLISCALRQDWKGDS
jgi:hypothetical protein